VDPVPDPLLLRKSGSAGNRTRDLCICSQKLWPRDHRGGLKTYNVKYNSTLRLVRAKIVAVEKPSVLHKLTVCICSLRYPAHNAHAPYCHLWHVPLYSIFPHYLKKRNDFQEKVIEHKMCISSFFTAFVQNIFHVKKNWARYDQKYILVFMLSPSYSCAILIFKNRPSYIWDGRTATLQKLHFIYIFFSNCKYWVF
jgi:hypothetical protein